MRKVVVYLLISIIIAGIVIGATGVIYFNKPDIKNDLTQDQKDKLTATFNTEEYEIIDDWTRGNEYCFMFKPVGKTKCITNYADKMATEDLTLDELREVYIIEILKTYAEEDDKQDMGNKGYKVSWK